MADLNETVRAALASFQRLDEGKAAPTVAVHIEGQHISASWVGTVGTVTPPTSTTWLKKYVKYVSRKLKSKERSQNSKTS